ncbi:hypothetical protein [Neorhizobium sp. S3-V5DH]|uniref:hypothetical protein n=1 Tax=Neorhizobium sp. S3-V5DH TaxID=2485166 RepID=UPI00104CBE28|nr:hypothetical protein [Neorhizobium sp. S3-V5DH]TCV75928.1 hypothetical protein EDE09_101211 [Neorhizobium sp. S3-V5DH]
MQNIAASITGFLLWFLMAIPALAGDQHGPKKVMWISATIGGARLQVPLVHGLLISTTDRKNDFHLSGGQADHVQAEIRNRLQSMANSETGLQLSNLTLMIDKVCASGVDVPLCRHAMVPPAEKAHVSWIEVIHRPDMAFAMELLSLKEAGEAPLSGTSSFRRITHLHKNQGHPYACPPDREFGFCWMYMKLGDDLLAVIMFWREKNMSHLTPFAQIADDMGMTIAQLMKE